MALAVVVAGGLAGASRAPAGEGVWRRDVATRTLSIPGPSGALAATVYLPPEPPGPAPGLVLSHGATRRARHLALYVVLARALALRGYVVLTFDYRGHGESPSNRSFEAVEDFDFEADLAAAIAAARTLPEVDPARLGVVGHSRGAGIALAAAATDPRVRWVVAVSPPRRVEEIVADPVRLARHGRKIAEAMGREAPVPAALAAAVTRRSAAEVLLAQPAHVPVLLVDGALEPARDRASLAALAERAPAPTRYETIAGADHYYGTDWWRDGAKAPFPYAARVLDRLVDAIDHFARQHAGAAGPPPAPERS